MPAIEVLELAGFRCQCLSLGLFWGKLWEGGGTTMKSRNTMPDCHVMLLLRSLLHAIKACAVSSRAGLFVISSVLVGCSQQDKPSTEPPKSVIATNQPAAADPNLAANSTQYQKYSGTWQIVSQVENGLEVPQELLKDVRVVINREKYSVYHGLETVMKDWVWQLDSAEVPVTYEIQVPDGPYKGKTIYGICEMDGDVSRYCDIVGTDPSLRPDDFAAPTGSGRRLFVYKRIAE
ncbi:MAG TPA: hypothetical protein DIT89_15565 [Planctomycetaceae bacterium]|nr:hypothetical protein [Planctomycetaceae bacterium]